VGSFHDFTFDPSKEIDADSIASIIKRPMAMSRLFRLLGRRAFFPNTQKTLAEQTLLIIAWRLDLRNRPRDPDEARSQTL